MTEPATPASPRRRNRTIAIVVAAVVVAALAAVLVATGSGDDVGDAVATSDDGATTTSVDLSDGTDTPIEPEAETTDDSAADDGETKPPKRAGDSRSGDKAEDSEPDGKQDADEDKARNGTSDSPADVGSGVRNEDGRVVLEKAVVDGDRILLTVGVRNRQADSKPYGPDDWHLETESGAVIDPSPYDGDDALGSGSLSKREKASGVVAFDAPAGTYRVVYAPESATGEVPTWTITV